MVLCSILETLKLFGVLREVMLKTSSWSREFGSVSIDTHAV